MASASEGLFAAIADGDVTTVREAVEADPSLAVARDADGVSALMQARYRGDPALTETIRSRVPELDLFEAAAFGDVDRLRALLAEAPETVRSISGDGFTPLHFAAFFGETEAARVLLASGAPVDAAGRGWMTGTPLHSAASANRTEVAALLLEAGADPNARQAHGWTPLHSAARNGNAPMARLLLEAGANLHAVNDDGMTVQDLAAESGDAETISTLEG